MKASTKVREIMGPFSRWSQIKNDSQTLPNSLNLHLLSCEKQRGHPGLTQSEVLIQKIGDSVPLTAWSLK